MIMVTQSQKIKAVLDAKVYRNADPLEPFVVTTNSPSSETNSPGLPIMSQATINNAND